MISGDYTKTYGYLKKIENISTLNKVWILRKQMAVHFSSYAKIVLVTVNAAASYKISGIELQFDNITHEGYPMR